MRSLFQLRVRVFYPDCNRLLLVCRLLFKLDIANRMQFARESPNDRLKRRIQDCPLRALEPGRLALGHNDASEGRTPPADFRVFQCVHLNRVVFSPASRNLGGIPD